MQPQNALERCRSGRSGRTRNAVYGQLYRGFESLPFRKKTKQGDVDLSTSFCFCSTTHANLFVGCSDVKTKVVDLSTPCVVLILQGARRRGKGKTSSACATKSIPYSVTQLFHLASFFRFKGGIRSVGGVSGDLSACGCCLLSQIFVFV